MIVFRLVCFHLPQPGDYESRPRKYICHEYFDDLVGTDPCPKLDDEVEGTTPRNYKNHTSVLGSGVMLRYVLGR